MLQVLGFFCQSLALNYGMAYAGNMGTSYYSFLTTSSWCLMTTSLLLFCYVFSEKSFSLVRQSLFVSISKNRFIDVLWDRNFGVLIKVRTCNLLVIKALFSTHELVKEIVFKILLGFCMIQKWFKVSNRPTNLNNNDFGISFVIFLSLIVSLLHNEKLKKNIYLCLKINNRLDTFQDIKRTKAIVYINIWYNNWCNKKTVALLKKLCINCSSKNSLFVNVIKENF